MRILVYILFLSPLSGLAQINLEIPLDSGWVFTNDLIVNRHPATVPGVVHLDLFANELIKDPYFEKNEDELRWIEDESWEYYYNLEIPDSLMEYKHLDLVFKGLDTYAEIWINQEPVLKTNNMFREWTIDVKPFVHKGSNELSVVFNSPIRENEEKVRNNAYELPAGNETVDLKVSPYTRKAAYHFGWDWGPRFVTCGIWRPVYLRCWNDIRMESVRVITHSISLHQATAEFTYEIFSDTETDAYTLESKNSIPLNLKKGINIVKESIYIENPKIWYPNGYGQPEMTKSFFKITKDKELVLYDMVSFAVRTIELVQEEDPDGTAFYFKVNGLPIFIRGANYIPQDLFLPRVSPLQYSKLINLAREANMNMLRVWGGGIYEDDLFYDLCDQNGIMVWQDFMFANSMYPNDKEFTENITEEIVYNIKRLRNHPCIALWCGNNEIEVAWNNWGWQNQYHYSTADSTEIWENYQHIFHELIPDLVEKYDSMRNYVPTTPLSNWGKKENFNHSTMHYWGVWHGKEPIDSFRTNVGRFMVEYGFQSYPKSSKLSRYIADSNLYLGSPAMDARQKSYIGNGIIDENIQKYYGQARTFKQWCEFSQFVQAKALDMAISSHRLASPFCMGTMLWQLNDCWPGPSWSIIDYEGSPKEAYWTVKNRFQPLVAIGDTLNDSFSLTMINDLPRTFNGSCKVAIHQSDQRIENEDTYFFKLGPLSQTTVLNIPFSDLAKTYGKGDLVVLIRVFDRDKGKRFYRDQFNLRLN